MPTYTTEYVKNLKTGKPFTFEVTDEKLARFELQKKLVNAGQAPMLGDLNNITQVFEFTLFPAYQDLLKIWFDNEFTPELMTKILNDFGADEQFIQRLLEDQDYISQTMPWFEGITCDGERAACTLKIVYDQTQSYFKPGPAPRTVF